MPSGAAGSLDVVQGAQLRDQARLSLSGGTNTVGLAPLTNPNPGAAGNYTPPSSTPAPTGGGGILPTLNTPAAAPATTPTNIQEVPTPIDNDGGESFSPAVADGQRTGSEPEGVMDFGRGALGGGITDIFSGVQNAFSNPVRTGAGLLAGAMIPGYNIVDMAARGFTGQGLIGNFMDAVGMPNVVSTFDPTDPASWSTDVRDMTRAEIGAFNDSMTDPATHAGSYDIDPETGNWGYTASGGGEGGLDTSGVGDMSTADDDSMQSGLEDGDGSDTGGGGAAGDAGDSSADDAASADQDDADSQGGDESDTSGGDDDPGDDF